MLVHDTDSQGSWLGQEMMESVRKRKMGAHGGNSIGETDGCELTPPPSPQPCLPLLQGDIISDRN